MIQDSDTCDAVYIKLSLRPNLYEFLLFSINLFLQEFNCKFLQCFCAISCSAPMQYLAGFCIISCMNAYRKPSCKVHNRILHVCPRPCKCTPAYSCFFFARNLHESGQISYITVCRKMQDIASIIHVKPVQ